MPVSTASAPTTSRLSRRILKVRHSSNLTSSEKLISRVLLDFIGNKPEGICWPSLRRIAQEASVSIRTAQRAIRGLLTKGYVTREERYRDNGSQTSSIYRWIDSASAPPPQNVTPPSRQNVTPRVHQEKRPIKKACCLNDSVKKRFIKLEERPDEFRKFSSCKKACDDAIRIGFLRDCDSDRLVFFTAYASVCRKIAANKVRSPARLLRFLLENRNMLVESGTQEDEDTARIAMRKLSNQTSNHVIKRSDNSDCSNARMQSCR